MVTEARDTEDLVDCSSRSEVRLNALRCTVAQQCLDAGWHGITDSSLNALVDVLDRYLKTMSRRIAGYTELGGREEAAVQDFCRAFRDVEPSATLKDLSSFSANLKDSPLDVDLHYPLPARQSEMYRALSGGLMLPVGNDDGTDGNDVNRPDWMDPYLSFPPLDQGLPATNCAASGDKAGPLVTEEGRAAMAAVASIVIGDDDEDVAEYQQMAAAASSMQPLVPSSAATAAAITKTPETAWPRKLKCISFDINGQLVTTTTAAVIQSRLPVELKPIKEMKHLTPPAVLHPEKRKKESKKVKASEPPAKKQRIPSPETHTPGPIFTPDTLKMTFSKSGKKKSNKSETPVASPVQHVQTVHPKTPPEVKQVIHHTVPAVLSEPSPRPPTVKFKSPAGFAEAWKQGKKDTSEKAKTAKEKKSDKDREKEREIKRELERVKERELEAELKLAALARPPKPHKLPVEVLDVEPVRKKHKKHHADFTGPLDGVDFESARKKHKKQHVAGAAPVEMSNPFPTPSAYAPPIEVTPRKDAILPPHGNPPIPKLTIPKLKLTLGGKDVKSYKSSIKSEPQFLPDTKPHSHATASPTVVTPKDSHRRQFIVPAAEEPIFYDALPAAPLDLSMSSRSVVPVQPQILKPSGSSKSSSKHKGSHGVPVASIVPVIPTPSRPPPILEATRVVAPPQKAAPSKPTARSEQVPLIPKQPKLEPLPVPPPTALPAAPPVVPAQKVPEGEVSKIWICPGCLIPDDGSQAMVGCDRCDEWYHWPCVGLMAEPTVEKWFCPSCVEKQMSKNKSKKSRKR